MSRILRRPMFRGGPVDSRGTGITANLGYNNGGRVGYNRGMLVQPPGASRLFSIEDVLKQTGAPMTGQQIFDYAADKGMNLGNIKLNQYTKYIPETVEVKSGEDIIERPFSEILREKGFQTYEDPTQILGGDDTQGTTEVLDTVNVKLDEKGNVVKDELGNPIYTGNQGEIKKILETKQIKNNLLSTDSILNSQNTANEELTLEEIRDTLGYKKARSRDMGDMLARASASFLGTGGVREGLAEFMKSEAAAGPGRAEKIETAAATFMLQDKAQSKRDRANVELMKSKIDYQIEAGEDISLPKALLAANKSGMLNNQRIICRYSKQQHLLQQVKTLTLKK
jgi:hypothetical protein